MQLQIHLGRLAWLPLPAGGPIPKPRRRPHGRLYHLCDFGQGREVHGGTGVAKMGKGQIIAHKGDGKYDVRLIYAYRNRITAKLVAISGEIAELEIKITALILDIGTEFATNLKKEEQLAILRLQKAAAQ